MSAARVLNECVKRGVVLRDDGQVGAAPSGSMTRGLAFDLDQELAGVRTLLTGTAPAEEYDDLSPDALIECAHRVGIRFRISQQGRGFTTEWEDARADRIAVAVSSRVGLVDPVRRWVAAQGAGGRAAVGSGR